MPVNPQNCTCRVCDNTGPHAQFTVREMLHGTREEYAYFQCSECGCLQMKDIPEDLSVFYPEDYCCHKDYRHRTKNVLRRVFDSARIAASLPEKGITAKIFDALAPDLDYIPWVRNTGTNTRSRILDIGCGTGKLLIRMSMGGFKTLHGIDPFISDKIHVGNVRIDRISTQDFIASQPERYDLVMLHHAFEHVPDPAETLRQARMLMKEHGTLLIRIPVADCYSREHYQENWFSWDAPRHTFLHSMKSMQYLAQQNGFVIQKVEHDATYHQLQKSELYREGIPATEQSKELKRFSRTDIRNFKALSDQLNRDKRGEQAAFYLQKSEQTATHTRAA